MIVATVLFTWSMSLIDALLSALGTRPAAALLTTPSIELFTGATVPSPTSTYGSFTRPTFHGYAITAVTLVGPVNIGTDAQAMIGTVTFVATAGGTIADTITGYLLTDGVGAYYGAERIQAPIPIANPGDFVTINLVLPLPFQVLNN
jgi:hypothetical protein